MDAHFSTIFTGTFSDFNIDIIFKTTTRSKFQEDAF